MKGVNNWHFHGCVYKYVDVGVNNLLLYERPYDYVGAGVNDRCVCERTTTHELASVGANNWCTYNHACTMGLCHCATPS